MSEQSKETTIIPGFGIGGYKSFANEIQWMTPLSKANVVIGENNVGKSNLLLFIADKLCSVANSAWNTRISGISDFDLNNNLPGSRFSLGLSLSTTTRTPSSKLGKSLLKSLYDELNKTGELTNIQFSEKNGYMQIDNGVIDELQTILDRTSWYQLASELEGNSASNVPVQNVKTVLYHALDCAWTSLSSPPILVPAFRECNRTAIVEGVPKNYELFDGSNFGDFIGHFENPVEDADHKNAMYEQFMNFVKKVLGRNDVKVSVPRGQVFVQVKIGAKTRRLEELGSGIYEVIFLAAAATLHSNRVVCIEEPEIHVHPTWQRKLVELLLETSNQYFISTHSAHIMDIPGISVFRLCESPSGTIINNVVSSRDNGTCQ